MPTLHSSSSQLLTRCCSFPFTPVTLHDLQDTASFHGKKNTWKKKKIKISTWKLAGTFKDLFFPLAPASKEKKKQLTAFKKDKASYVRPAYPLPKILTASHRQHTGVPGGHPPPGCTRRCRSAIPDKTTRVFSQALHSCLKTGQRAHFTLSGIESAHWISRRFPVTLWSWSENTAKGCKDLNSYCALYYNFYSFQYLVPLNLIPCLDNTSFKDILLLTGKSGMVSTPRSPLRERASKNLEYKGEWEGN